MRASEDSPPCSESAWELVVTCSHAPKGSSQLHVVSSVDIVYIHATTSSVSCSWTWKSLVLWDEGIGTLVVYVL